jgi:chlorobactene glucosyltransferase
MELILSTIWCALVAWLIRRAFHQRRLFSPVVPSSGRTAAAVAVIVPARDESSRIARCLESLRAQRYDRERLNIIVIDDDSSDDTALIVAQLAQRDPRIRLLRAPPLPPGWKGKVHACWFGARAAPADVQWLCFLDADMHANPLLISSAIVAASAEGLDLLSLAPRHELRSVAERLIIPCGLYLQAFSQDLSKVQAPDSGEAIATGQFMLMRREAYEDVGGHAAVSSAICEDVELARRLKRHGYRVLMQDGSRLLATRMYTGWRTLWPGIAKNLIDTLGGPTRTIATALAAVVIAGGALLLPILDAIACRHGATQACVALAPAVLGSAAAFALHIAGAAHFEIPLWYGLLFPVGYVAGAGIALDSVRWRLAGRVRWKGRVYQ